MKSTILAIIDAQNLFAHPNGFFSSEFAPRTQVTIRKTVDRIHTLLSCWHARDWPVIYCCSHSEYLPRNKTAVSQWEIHIIDKLSPPPAYPYVFWRRGAEGPIFSDALKERIQDFPRTILVSGFYGHKCVVRFFLEALKNGLRARIVTDCTYPFFNIRQQNKLFGYAVRNNVLPNTRPSAYFVSSRVLTR